MGVSKTRITGAQFPDVLTTPPEASAAWKAFTVHVHEAPDHGTMLCSDHLVGLQFRGNLRLRRNLNGRSEEGWCGSGNVMIIPADHTSAWEVREYSGAPLGVSVFVPKAFLSRVVEQDLGADPNQLEIRPTFLSRDPVIESLLTRLASEARYGSPSGSLYAESACEFLAHHLIRTHSSLTTPPYTPSGGLPARRIKLVLDYIEEYLAQAITLPQLAALAEVSPRHFERAFRQALGVPPHGYVLQRRVDAARRLLAEQPTLAIHEVAARSGFSSSSHLAAAFRRQTGHTPSSFRRLWSR